MAVHVFPVESVRQSMMGGDSIQNAFQTVRTFLGQQRESGDVVDKHMECADRAAVQAAIEGFLDWAKIRPSAEPKVLWLSLHGKPPEGAGLVGTAGVSAAYTLSAPDQAEVIDWTPAFSKLCGECPPNVVILTDVCWGASPTAPARVTGKAGANPAFLFGPLRAAHRLELDTAAGLVFGLLARGTVPAVDDAKSLVNQLNACFPPDAANGNALYRVWWWDEAGIVHREPDSPQHLVRPKHTRPGA